MARPVMTPVVSSNIKEIGYNNESKELYVTFARGATYRYDSVPEVVYNQLKNSSSKGSFVNVNIARIYKFTKV